MFIQILLFIASCLPVVAGVKLYDLFRSRWEDAEPGTKEREHYSRLWHATGFWTVMITCLIIGLHRFEFLVILRFFPLLSVFVWVVYDIAWNLWHNESILYPGNGGGSFLEMIFSWLTRKLGFDLTFWTFITKFLGLVVSLIIAFA